MIFQNASFRKISVLGDDGEPVEGGMIPNLSIVGCAKSESMDMSGARIKV